MTVLSVPQFLSTLSNVDYLIYQKITIKQKHRVCHANPNTFLLFTKILWEVALYLPQEPVETDKVYLDKTNLGFLKKKIKYNTQRAVTIYSFCEKDSNEVQAWAAFKKFCWEAEKSGCMSENQILWLLTFFIKSSLKYM